MWELRADIPPRDRRCARGGGLPRYHGPPKSPASPVHSMFAIRGRNDEIIEVVFRQSIVKRLKVELIVVRLPPRGTIEI